VNFQDDVIETFEIRFDSINKDCDRYSDALIELVETEEIERKDYFTLSGTGSLWITFQYIDAGLVDAVETYLKRGEVNRDTFGPLHKNTRLTLDRLVETGAHEIPSLRKMIAQYEAHLRRFDLTDHELDSYNATVETAVNRRRK